MPRAVGDTKMCSRCRQTFSLDKFWKDLSRFDGYNNHCKECVYKRVKGQYSARKQQEVRKREKKQYVARTLVTNAIASGKLVKDPCYLCGEQKVAAHHLDYDFPDKVIWLCSKHHAAVHREIK